MTRPPPCSQLPLVLAGRPVDQRFKDVRRSEDEYTARQDRNLLPRLRIAAHALALVANREAPERRDLYRFATRQGLDDFRENRLNQIARFVPGRATFLDHPPP